MTLKREQRLRRNADFRRVRTVAPRSWSHPLLALYATANDLEHTRVGVTVGKRVGNAVARNRARRRISEAIRLRYDRLKPGHDLVFVARPAVGNATWPALQAALETVIGRAGMWRAASNAAPAYATRTTA